ncbi:MAG TPA: pyridoxal phosphate-dependent aminotransferase, partial [Pseudonocardiaceae bacterium]|nr:pyridoxal phosphate-dependent aminotransferase [Pseudonocardiaceae bacterium]
DFVSRGIPSEIAANVCVDSGTTRLFAAFLHAYSEPGDVFLVPRSYYHPLPAWCELCRVELELVATSRTDDYKLTAAALDAWYSRHRGPRPRGLFLFNPTQTGALYSHDELVALAEVIRRRNLVVLEDSVFASTEFPGQPAVLPLSAAAPDLAERVVTLNGASKAFNLANIRIGWACGPAALIRRMNAHTVTTAATVPFLAKAMALAALRAPADYLAVNAAECAERAALITALVDECNGATGGEPLFTVAHQPQAGHAILVTAPGLRGRRLPSGATINSSIDVTRFLLSAAKVATSPGYSLGFDDTELRLAFGSVGVKHTYPPGAAHELRSALHQLAAICGGSRQDVTRRVYEASEAMTHGSPENCREPFHPGRELITTAFRDRITPAVQQLLGYRPVHQLSWAG